MSGAVGEIYFRRRHPDGSPVVLSALVPKPKHIEVDFFLCTVREDADNEDYFFGPTVAA